MDGQAPHVDAEALFHVGLKMLQAIVCVCVCCRCVYDEPIREAKKSEAGREEPELKDNSGTDCCLAVCIV